MASAEDMPCFILVVILRQQPVQRPLEGAFACQVHFRTPEHQLCTDAPMRLLTTPVTLAELITVISRLPCQPILIVPSRVLRFGPPMV